MYVIERFILYFYIYSLPPAVWEPKYFKRRRHLFGKSFPSLANPQLVFNISYEQGRTYRKAQEGNYLPPSPQKKNLEFP